MASGSPTSLPVNDVLNEPFHAVKKLKQEIHDFKTSSPAVATHALIDRTSNRLFKELIASQDAFVPLFWENIKENACVWLDYCVTSQSSGGIVFCFIALAESGKVGGISNVLDKSFLKDLKKRYTSAVKSTAPKPVICIKKKSGNLNDKKRKLASENEEKRKPAMELLFEKLKC